MKRVLVTMIAIIFSTTYLSAAVHVAPHHLAPALTEDVLSQFATSSRTSSQDWGCPVSEMVVAKTEAEALGKIKDECVAQVRREAIEKTRGLGVVQTEVIFPDIVVTQANGGFHLNGTFFLRTEVMLPQVTGR